MWEGMSKKEETPTSQPPRDTEQAFNEAFVQYSDELLRHAQLRISDRERALELTQECFLRTWQYASRGEEIRELRPFLYRTLRHLIIDEYRKAKSYSLEGMVNEEEGESIESLLPPEETNTLEAAMERFDARRALELLKKLPDSYREVLSLRYIEGLSPKEIAVILEESENVVSVRIYRSLKKLRVLFDAS